MTEGFWRNVRTTIEVGVLVVPPILIASLLLAWVLP